MKTVSLFAAALAALCLFVVAPATTQAEPEAKPDTETTSKPVDYLVISADALAGVAREWADYRASHGRVAKVLSIADIAGALDVDQPDLNEIKSVIIEHAGDPITPGFQVLLIGDCPDDSVTKYDAKTEIPWMLTRQVDSNPEPTRRKRIPTDNFYADIIADDNALPDIAVGRIPARTVEQARMALKKVKAYESAAQGEWLRNLTFFAGEGRFGEQIDKMLEGLFIRFAEQTINQAYNVRMTYANINSTYAYAPSRFSDKVIEEANRGAILLTYLGHGLYDRLDNMDVEVDGKRVRYPILTSEHVDQFNIPDGKLPVMMIIACQTGQMDHPQGCLAEKICFTEKAPVAIIASSRDSHPYSNTILQKAVVKEMIDNKAATLGQAFTDAKRELILAEDPDRRELEMMAFFVIPKKTDRDELNRSHLSMYNLTGDPGLRLRHPGLEFGLQLPEAPTAKSSTEGFNFRLSATEKLPELELTAWIECKRASLANPVKQFDKAGLTSGDEKIRAATEAVIVENHAISNNKLIATVAAEPLGTTEEGKTFTTLYQGKIDSPLAPGDYILKVSARDSKGERVGFAATTFTIK